VKHASFFSGVGGLDLGFERAGIHTVSVSEIDPYANAVLAERFPDAPNLGSITEVEANEIPEADIWSGGFPCQDLSVAGKRAGFAGKRSSLAFTFLDLVEQRRPRWLVLENVPGLFSSNKGADFGRLLYEMEQLGYGVSWRTLDARYFGVAQRRRRVFLVASLESDRAAEVLLECEGCERHPSPRWTQRQGVAGGAPDGSGIAGAITRRFSKGVNSTIDEPLIVSPSPDSDGVRAADGLAGRLDNQSGVDTFGAATHRALQARDWKAGVSNQDIGEDGYLVGYQTRADEKNGNFSITEAEVANSLSALWPGDTSHRSMTLVQAVIQDSREMANKTQNGLGVSTEDISYTLTGVDRQAVVAESILSFPSRFGSNANVTEGQAQSMAHSSGAPAVLRAIVAPTLTASNDPSRSPQSSEVTRQYQAVFEAANGISFGVANDDNLLPVGLDSHRYRCCGNGVVAPVAEWIGRRIVEVDRRWREEGK
jgi:DNA-cytosine methyltransferase